MLKATFAFICCLMFFQYTQAQSVVRISGVVSDSVGHSLPQVTILVIGQSASASTNADGKYVIYSNSHTFSLKFNLLGYKPTILSFAHGRGNKVTANVSLAANVNELEQVNITGKENQLSNAAIINIADAGSIPLVSGNFESLLKTLPGVSTNNELSAQYSVRGGNFDENLVYLNDIEINRPILVRNGQQEGLSFINSDLVTKAKFSAGGFESKYGDKLSSVLDVKYERPDSNMFIIGLSMLNSAISTKQKFKNSFLLAGIRYKNNSNVLIKQDEKGNYRPNFGDAQLLYQYYLSAKFNLSAFATLNLGRFQLFPISKQTKFSTIGTTFKLDVDYDGKEIDDYKTFGTAVTASYSPHNSLIIKFINSYFKTVERENYNILGSYYLNVEDAASPPAIGILTPLKNRGIYVDFGNNSLNTDWFSSALKIDQDFGSHVFSLGLKAQTSKYYDILDAYNYVDSTNSVSTTPNYQNIVNTNNILRISNLSAYIQDSYILSSLTNLQLGTRITYNSLSKQFLISPRLLLAYRPSGNNKILRFSAGVYQQPPSYRTIRNLDGNLFLDQKAQRSYNTSLGYEYAFDAFGTRLKFFSEGYFKYSDLLIPYKLDNLQIKYRANQTSKGYAYGADFSIGGEFVKDMVSYFRLSLMHSNENIRDNAVQVQNPVFLGYIKRPTDQRVNFSGFFQDKLLSNPSYKVHLNLLYGSRLPIGPVNGSKYKDDFYIPAYRRVDIGFSKDFLEDGARRKPQSFARNFSSIILFLEVFNLLNIDNTVSYLWLKDGNGVQYAVPNYLTDRQFNIKLIVKFGSSKNKTD